MARKLLRTMSRAFIWYGLVWCFFCGIFVAVNLVCFIVGFLYAHFGTFSL